MKLCGGDGAGRFPTSAPKPSRVMLDSSFGPLNNQSEQSDLSASAPGCSRDHRRKVVNRVGKMLGWSPLLLLGLVAVPAVGSHWYALPQPVNPDCCRRTISWLQSLRVSGPTRAVLRGGGEVSWSSGEKELLESDSSRADRSETEAAGANVAQSPDTMLEDLRCLVRNADREDREREQGPRSWVEGDSNDDDDSDAFDKEYEKLKATKVCIPGRRSPAVLRVGDHTEQVHLGRVPCRCYLLALHLIARCLTEACAYVFEQGSIDKSFYDKVGDCMKDLEKMRQDEEELDKMPDFENEFLQYVPKEDSVLTESDSNPFQRRVSSPLPLDLSEDLAEKGAHVVSVTGCDEQGGAADAEVSASSGEEQGGKFYQDEIDRNIAELQRGREQEDGSSVGCRCAPNLSSS